MDRFETREYYSKQLREQLKVRGKKIRQIMNHCVRIKRQIKL